MKSLLPVIALTLTLTSSALASQKLSLNAKGYYDRLSNMQPHTLQILINENSSRSVNRQCRLIMQSVRYGTFSEVDYQAMSNGLIYQQTIVLPMVKELQNSDLTFTTQHLDLLELLENRTASLKLCIDKIDAYYE